jgi:hypothetical protein
MQPAVVNPMARDANEFPQGSRAMGDYARDGADVARIRDYREADRLLDVDEHRRLFVSENPDAKPAAESNWIPLDFPGMLARLLRDYTFGAELRIEATTASGQTTVDHLLDVNPLVALGRQVTQTLPAYGDAVLRVVVEDREVEDGPEDQTEPRAVFKYVAPWHYFPEVDPLDAERVKSVTLAWVFERPKHVAGAMPWVVLREVHVPGSYYFGLNLWDGSQLGAAVPLDAMPELELEEGVHETGISEIPIVHLAFDRKAGQHFGRSEFARVRRIILALENRLAQEDEVLERHARPKLIVGPGVLNAEGKANLADFDVIEVEPSILEKAVKPEYLTWDTQIEGIKHEIEKLEEYFYQTTETSPASFGLERDGSQVESARALKFKAHRTVNKVDVVRDEWGRALRDLFRIAIKMENAARREDGVGALARTRIRIVWPDAIVEDEAQEVQDFVALKGAGLVSRKRAVRDLYGLTDAEAEAEVREILQDEVDSAAAAFGGSQPEPAGGPGFGGEDKGDEDEDKGDEGKEPPKGIEPAAKA